ncbi:hypothetical protein [Camelimonas fluminis]|nr:hypothetical protein [Camelimonas fluminis]
MQDDNQDNVPVADEPQAEAKQSEAVTPEQDPAKTGQEADASPDGDEAAGEDSDEQDGEKRKKRSGVDRLKRQLADARAENEMLRSRGAAPVDSEAIKRAVDAEIGAPPKLEDFEDYFAFERAMTGYEVEKRLAEREVKRQAQSRHARATVAQQQAIEDFRERELDTAKAIPDYAQTMAAAGNMPASDAVTKLVIESDKGPLLKYHFAKNPGELQRLSAMDPLSAARAVGRLEASLSLPTANRNSKAPPPNAPLKGGAGPASDEAKLDAYIKRKYGG